MIELGILNKSNNELPKYETEEASGMDVRAFVEEPEILKSGEIKIIPTGLYFNIPKGMEIQVRPRSGLAAKFGVTVLNTPGTIDSDYTGELKIILINLGETVFIVENGDRIAQIVPSLTINQYINVTQLESMDKVSKRNVGGFGSTGIN